MVARDTLAWTLSIGLIVAASGVSAQQSPDPPSETVTLPEYAERVLATGLRVLTVPDDQAEATTYTLLIPGGAAADPVGREGSAEAVAAAMRRASADGDPRIVLGVGSTGDAIALTVVDSANRPRPALRRISRAVLSPELHDDFLNSFKSARLEELEVALGAPDFVAMRALTRALFAGHPYARSVHAASIAALTVPDLRAWHERHVRPAGAVLAISGPVRAATVEEAAREALIEWTGPSSESPTHPASEPREPHDPEWFLVHRPTANSATMHLGFELPVGSDASWTSLTVLDLVMGGGEESRLFRVDGPDGEGIVAGAFSAAQRRIGPGLFHVRASVQPGRAAAVLHGLLVEFARAGAEFMSQDEVQRSREPLARSFPRQLAAAEGVAALLAVNRVYGLPDDQLTSYVERVRSVGSQDLHDVASRYLDTARVAVVVVGDATLLLDDLSGLGPFSVIDAEGRPLGPEDLRIADEIPVLDGATLEPLELRYQVLMGGQEIGSATRSLRAVDDALEGTGPGRVLAFSSDASIGEQRLRQSVTFTVPEMRPVSATASVVTGVQSVSLEAEVRGGRFEGVLSGPSGSQALAGDVPDGAIMGDMLEVAAWLLAGRGEGSFRLAVTSPETGETNQVVLRVREPEEVSVAAGTFLSVPVEVGGESPQTIWISVEEPRVPVRMRPAGAPIVVELTQVGSGG